MEAAAIAALESVPEWIWDGELPVPVERIATDHFGLLIRDTDDPASVPGAPALEAGEYLSGMLLSDRGEIWVNSNDTRRWPPRRRFTIAHELGHWQLHRGRAGGSVLCRAAELSGGRAGLVASNSSGAATGQRPSKLPPLPLPEAEANAFAAAMLMPAFHLRAEHQACDGRLEQLQIRFDSSADAMRRRLRTLGLEFSEQTPANGSVV
jgi:hypothetical protein